MKKNNTWKELIKEFYDLLLHNKYWNEVKLNGKFKNKKLRQNKNILVGKWINYVTSTRIVQ